MRRLLAAAGAATILASLTVTSAHAEPAGVILSWETQVIPLDYGHLVIVICNASADPGEFGDVATATSVTCSLDGASRTQANPGHEAITPNFGATLGETAEFCISGEAVFVHAVTGALQTPTAGPVCETIDL